jgi:arylsulfatase A-like enzyme
VGFKAKPFSTPPLPKLLADAGYATVLVGRNMHQVPESGDCGYQKRILGSTYVEDDEYDAFLRKAAPESGGIRRVIDRVGVNCNLWPAHAWPLAVRS